MAWFMGIDIGSLATKGVITNDGKLQVYYLLPSGGNYSIAVQKVRDELLAKAGLSLGDIASIATTGHGADSVPFSNQAVADVRCCARGIHHLFPAVRTVIDVQGQSSQVIRLNEKGQVINVVSSEKCASGSGRFLEIIARVLQMELNDIGPLALKSDKPVSFTTGCAVFGESEVISRIAEGISKEDIVAGVHKALADKLSALVDRVGLEKECAISGGGGLNIGLIKKLEQKLGVQLVVPPLPQLTNALGAAVIGEEEWAKAPSGKPLPVLSQKTKWEEDKEI
ncbi:MAG: acyl-CoA dehydratase activase [Dehalococcoidales bacterium]|nr:acyl-CoA dehydratase activase [Dehalococcoidales bacterium]